MIIAEHLHWDLSTIDEAPEWWLERAELWWSVVDQWRQEKAKERPRK